MPEYMYRFRSIENLLGSESRQGELDGQYIFFAGSETLNDPLEGYREYFWSGDEVLWKGLFRHYTRTLFLEVIKHLENSPELGSLLIREAAANQYKGIKNFGDVAFERLIESKIIKRHISMLSSGERHVKRSELQCHLQLIHKFAMHLTLSVTHETIPLAGFNPDSFDEKRLTDISTVFLDTLENEIKKSDSDEGLTLEESNQQTLSHLSQISFLAQYHQWKNHKGDRWFSLTMGFPEAYCEGLWKLNFPNWYVACFMSECTDSSIWGTYGNNHSAACLKFKTNGPPGKRSLNLKMPVAEGRNGVEFRSKDVDFKRVSYDEAFIEIDFFASMGNVPTPYLISDWFTDEKGGNSSRAESVLSDMDAWRKNYHENYRKSITVKLNDWKKENEYRLTMHSFAIDISSPKNRVIRYNFDDLEGIIFGINTSPEEKMKIVSKIEQLCKTNQRDDFKFYQARYDSSQQKIRIDEVKIRQLGSQLRSDL